MRNAMLISIWRTYLISMVRKATPKKKPTRPIARNASALIFRRSCHTEMGTSACPAKRCMILWENAATAMSASLASIRSNLMYQGASFVAGRSKTIRSTPGVKGSVREIRNYVDLAQKISGVIQVREAIDQQL